MVSEQSQAGNDRLMQSQPSGGSGSGGGDLGATAKDAAQDLKGTAQDVVQQTRETAGQVIDQAKEQATSQLDDRKDQVAESFGSVAEALRQAGKHLKENEQAPIGQYADKAAERVEQWAENLRGKDVQAIMRDVEDYARRQPALFLGGAFVVGLLAARFLKSTASRDEGQGNDRGGQGYQGGYRASSYRGYGGYGGYGGGERAYGSGYSGGSYGPSGRADSYGADTGAYRGGMGDNTGAYTGPSGYGATGERDWNAQGRETQ